MISFLAKKNLIEQNNDESGCAPRRKNVSFPMKTKSQSNLENLNHKNKIEMKNKFEDMEVCSQGTFCYFNCAFFK